MIPVMGNIKAAGILHASFPMYFTLCFNSTDIWRMPTDKHPETHIPAH